MSQISNERPPRQMSQTETKPCATQNCPNEILADSEFPTCEVCRVISNRNAVALLLDPNAPQALSIRRERVNQVITNMRADEMLAFVANVEYVYLEFQKVIKLHGIGNEKKKAFKSLAEQIEEGRESVERVSIRARQAKTREKKKESNIEKLAKKFGKTKEEAQAWMDEDINL